MVSTSRNKSGKNLRHVILYEFLPPSDGGIAQMAYEIVRELDERGFKTALCGFFDLLKHPMYKNVRYDLFPLPRAAWKNLKDLYCLALAIRLFLRYGQSVILYSLTWKTARVFTVLKKFFGWKLVLFAIGNEITRQIGGKKEHLMCRTFHQADRISAISTYTANRCRSIGITALHINNPGVDTNHFVAHDRVASKKHFGWEDKKVILTAGRVVARKGQDLVIRSLPAVLQQNENALYVIAGKGDAQEIDRLKCVARESGVAENVLFTGFFSDKDKVLLYNACDVYVMVSRDEKGAKDVEGFGITFLEAGSCGIPVIGSPCGGIPDAIEDGVSGFLVASDDPVALAIKLNVLLSDRNVALKIGMQARQRIEKEFTWQGYVDRMLSDFMHNEIKYL